MLTGYIARKFFLAHTTWYYRGRQGFELSHTLSMKPISLIVVGRLSENRDLTEPISIVASSMHNNIHPKDICLSLHLGATDIVPEFRTDFLQAWQALKALLQNPPVHARATIGSRLFRHTELQLEPNAITFKIPLFEKKVNFDCYFKPSLIVCSAHGSKMLIHPALF